MNFSSSSAFFDCDPQTVDPNLSRFQSLKGRFFCLRTVFEKILILPGALLQKICKTIFKAVGVILSAGLLILTLGTSCWARDFFVRRFGSLAFDLADWVLFPFAVLTCFAKLLLAFLVHPALYFRF